MQKFIAQCVFFLFYYFIYFFKIERPIANAIRKGKIDTHNSVTQRTVSRKVIRVTSCYTAILQRWMSTQFIHPSPFFVCFVYLFRNGCSFRALHIFEPFRHIAIFQN